MGLEKLQGLIITAVQGGKGDSEVVLRADLDRRAFRIYHRQDCCESVYLADVTGDLADICFSPILAAEAKANPPGAPQPTENDSFTWTFYELRTVKATVVLRWLGTSNGYYSEAVHFEEVHHNYVLGSDERE